MGNRKTILCIISLIVLILIAIYVYSEVNKLTYNTENKATFTNITDTKAKAELDKNNSIILLDVRTREEYIEKHIKNSILIPLDELKDKVTSEIKNKDTKIFVYCRSGNRSVTASNILIDLGYTNVYNLGGIIDWSYEVE